MTAATSTSEKSFFGARVHQDLAENKKLLILNSILSLLGLPLLAAILLFDEATEDGFEAYLYVGVSGFAIAISILLGIVIALFTFRYLYRKSLADMSYSLPITSKQRFLADYFSGLIVYLLPQLIAATLSVAIILTGSVFIQLEELWESLLYLSCIGISAILGMIMLYTLCVLSVVFCGSIFEAIFSIFLTNITIPVLIICAGEMIKNATYHFGLTYDAVFNSKIFTATSPAGAAAFLLDGGFDDNSYFTAMLGWFIPALIVTLIFFAAAYFLCIRRSAEDISKPLVYRSIFNIFLSLALFCLMSSFITDEDFWIPGTIISGLIFFIIELITNRGYKKMGRAFLRFGLTIGMTFAFFFVCEITEGFHIEQYVPKVSSVKSIEITANCCDAFSVQTDDAEVISAVTDIHRGIVDEFFNGSEYVPRIEEKPYSVNDATSLEVTYKLKNGSCIKREYHNVSGKNLSKLNIALFTCDEYAEDLCTRYLRTIDNNHTKFCITDRYGMSVTDIKMQKSTAREFLDAYKNDMRSLTEDKLKNSDIVCYLSGGYTLPVFDCFDGSIEKLLDIGVFEIENIIKPGTDILYCSNRIQLTDTLYDVSANPCACYKRTNNASTQLFGYHYNYESECCFDFSLLPYNYAEMLEKLVSAGKIAVFDEPVAGVVTIDSGIHIYIPDSEENRRLFSELTDFLY